MRPWLLVMLAVTMVATVSLALWPDETASDLQVTVRAAARTTPPAAPPATPRLAAVPSAPTAANRPPVVLPSRPADWPPVPQAGLDAWQGTPAPAAAARTAAAAASATTPPRPQPAVFPYRWIGELHDGDGPQVLLAGAQRTVAVRLGAALDKRWRLEAGANGVLQAQPLPDGEPLAVPGAPMVAARASRP